MCRRIGGLGYAVPGSVIAIAIVYPFGRIDNSIDAAAESWFGISTGYYQRHHIRHTFCLHRALSRGGHGLA